jgi:hypothetical protein
MITYNLANLIKSANEYYKDNDANIFFMFMPLTILLDILLLILQPLLFIIYKYIDTREVK